MKKQSLLGFDPKDDWDQQVLNVASDERYHDRKVDVWWDEEGHLQVAIDGHRQALEAFNNTFTR